MHKPKSFLIRILRDFLNKNESPNSRPKTRSFCNLQEEMNASTGGVRCSSKRKSPPPPWHLLFNGINFFAYQVQNIRHLTRATVFVVGESVCIMVSHKKYPCHFGHCLWANTPNQAETQLHSLERAAAGIGLYVNAHKTEYMCYYQTGDISTLEGTLLKLVDKFTYLGSSVESTEKDIKTRLTKAWTAINRLSIIWKSDLTDKMKRSFFQAAVTSILLYGCTTWALTKRLEKKRDGNYTRILCAILNKSRWQHPTRHQLYGHLPPITKTIQVRRTRHAGHCWRSRDELISDVLLWTPTHGCAKAGRPARTYIQQLCEDTGCCPEDLPREMNDREKWRERVRDIRATSTTWWWWWWWWCITFENNAVIIFFTAVSIELWEKSDFYSVFR